MAFEKFNNSEMGRIVNKISVTQGGQINFPAAFYNINELKKYKSAILYCDKEMMKVAIEFSEDDDKSGFKLVVSNDGKYGCYISSRAFFQYNGIDYTKFAQRYDYIREKIDNKEVFVIALKEKAM